jgi:DNA-binding NarL/FixJ family response regulator
VIAPLETTTERLARAGRPCFVTIVDDHRSYGEALALALGSALGGVQVCYADLEGADRPASGDPADAERVRQAALVLLDWQLGHVDGLDVARRLRGLPEPPHVVMVSGHHSPAFERMAVRAGAFAAISKHAPVAEIVEVIDRCRSGGHSVTTPAVDGDEADPVLTERQAEVLWHLSTGLDVQQIAARLYLSVATVRSYVRDALRRLDAHSQLEAVAKARRAGLIPVESTPPPRERS